MVRIADNLYSKRYIQLLKDYFMPDLAEGEIMTDYLCHKSFLTEMSSAKEDAVVLKA